jgi:helix-turn-helix protein
MASKLIWLPRRLMDSPVHNLRKFGVRQSDRVATPPSCRFDLEKSIDILFPMGKRPATPEEARAMANPLRMRIIRLCLHEALTNKQIAERVGRDPGTTLHHVRKLVATGFLTAEDVRSGPGGALEKPYRSTGKSWEMDVDDSGFRADISLAVLEAFREEVVDGPPGNLFGTWRLGVRLSPADREDLILRLSALAEEVKARDNPDGEPIGMFFGLSAAPSGRAESTGSDR